MVTPKSKYSWQIFRQGQLFADLTGLCTKRKFIINRNDSDQISFSISLDKLIAYAAKIHVNPQDIIQGWFSEVRVSRYGTVLTAGELEPWKTDVGSSRMVDLTFSGWFELLKWRRTSNTYNSQSALFITQDLFNGTLARSYGSQGNYSGFTVGNIPSPDSTNVYTTMQYDNTTLYDALQEMAFEHNGYDIEMSWDKKLNVYYPAIGQVRSDIIFSYPHGNVKDIQYSSDPTKSFNYMTARGKGIGPNQLVTTVQDITSENTFGLREDVIDYTNTTDPTQLANFAQEDLAIYKQPIILHKIVFDGSGRTSAPQVGTFKIGDQVRISVTNFQLYSDINQFFRIDQMIVEIDDNDMETVTATVSLPIA